MLLHEIFSGNLSLLRVLPQVYADNREPFHAHIPQLLSVLRDADCSEKLSLLQLTSMIANEKPDVGLATSLGLPSNKTILLRLQRHWTKKVLFSSCFVRFLPISASDTSSATIWSVPVIAVYVHCRPEHLHVTYFAGSRSCFGSFLAYTFSSLPNACFQRQSCHDP